MKNKVAKEILKNQKDELMSRPESDRDWELITALDIAIEALERDGTLSYDEVITSVFSCPVCGAIWRDKEDEE